MRHRTKTVEPEQLSLPLFDSPEVPEQEFPAAVAILPVETLPVVHARNLAVQNAASPGNTPGKSAKPSGNAVKKPAAKPVPAKREPFRLSGYRDPEWERLKGEVTVLARENNMRAIFMMFGKTHLCFESGRYYLTFTGQYDLRTLSSYDYRTSQVMFNRWDDFVAAINKTERGSMVFTVHLVYLMGNGEPVRLPITFELGKRQDNDYYAEKITVKAECPVDRLSYTALQCQDNRTIMEILKRTKPYVHDWLKEKGYNAFSYIQIPWMETLDKAGYAIASYVMRNLGGINSDSIDYLNRLLQYGTKPKDIFKTSKAVFTTLKNEDKISLWDVFRRMEKFGRIKDDTIRIAYDNHWDEKALEKINSILGKQYNGRQVFTMTSLVNYLNRLDMYEAIEFREAVQYLGDYLNMCNQLEMQPRIDGDSLKREHDIAARLCRNRRNEETARRMREAAERERKEAEEWQALGKEGQATRAARAEYKESVYFIRSIRDYDDLLDEARQQHNCVASYADRIANGETRIFTMRETAHPEKSLVTVELSPDCRTIRQKYLARNHTIRNKSITEFLNRWIRQIVA